VIDTASPAEVDCEWIRRRGFKEFVKRAWSIVETSTLVWNWHHDAMAEYLQAVALRQIRDLVMNVPPGMSKSRFASVLWQAWVWTIDPERRFFAASYSDENVLRDARDMRTLVSSDWYRERWPHVRLPSGGNASTAIGLYENTRRGFRKSDTWRGQWTGKHGDDHTVDDPLDPQGAASAAELDGVLEWWTGTMSTRFRDLTTGTRTLVMQRLHEKDLTREFFRAGAEVLCLPMRYERAHPYVWLRDPRTVDGELLFPARFPEAEVAKLERILGPSQAAAQLQQRPAPAGGMVFQSAWFKSWVEYPDAKTATWCIELDATFKKTDDGSFVELQVWCDDGPRHYLVDERHERMGLLGTLNALHALLVLYPRVRTVRVEEKANGAAIVDVMRADPRFVGIAVVTVTPDGGKEARAMAAQPEVAAGLVYLPDVEYAKYPDGRRGAAWVPAFLHEVVTFPKSENDDRVDAMSQHLNAVRSSFAAKFLAAYGGKGSK